MDAISAAIIAGVLGLGPAATGSVEQAQPILNMVPGATEAATGSAEGVNRWSREFAPVAPHTVYGLAVGSVAAAVIQGLPELPPGSVPPARATSTPELRLLPVILPEVPPIRCVDVPC